MTYILNPNFFLNIEQDEDTAFIVNYDEDLNYYLKATGLVVDVLRILEDSDGVEFNILEEKLRPLYESTT